MCNFISWIERPEGIYFLTDDELATDKGKAMVAKMRKVNTLYDIIGHGAITKYYGFGGVHRECEYFSSPDNFPPEIVEAIKEGKFSQLGVCEGILTQEALDRLNSAPSIKEARGKLDEASGKLEEAGEKWEEVCGKWEEAGEKLEEARGKLDEASGKLEEAGEKLEEARGKWEEVCGKWAEARGKWREAREKWEGAKRPIFWQLAIIPENRKEIWR